MSCLCKQDSNYVLAQVANNSILIIHFKDHLFLIFCLHVLTGAEDTHFSVQSQHRTKIDITECSLLISLN